MQINANAEVANQKRKQAAPRILRKRIGSTTLEVSIRFSETSRETMEDKTLRLMKSEVRDGA